MISFPFFVSVWYFNWFWMPLRLSKTHFRVILAYQPTLCPFHGKNIPFHGQNWPWGLHVVGDVSNFILDFPSNVIFSGDVIARQELRCGAHVGVILYSRANGRSDETLPRKETCADFSMAKYKRYWNGKLFIGEWRVLW